MGLGISNTLWEKPYAVPATSKKLGCPFHTASSIIYQYGENRGLSLTRCPSFPFDRKGGKIDTIIGSQPQDCQLCHHNGQIPTFYVAKDVSISISYQMTRSHLPSLRLIETADKSNMSWSMLKSLVCVGGLDIKLIRIKWTILSL